MVSKYHNVKALFIVPFEQRTDLSVHMVHINSFAANVADRRRHSRLPTSPIGDLGLLPNAI